MRHRLLSLTAIVQVPVGSRERRRDYKFVNSQLQQYLQNWITNLNYRLAYADAIEPGLQIVRPVLQPSGSQRMDRNFFGSINHKYNWKYIDITKTENF